MAHLRNDKIYGLNLGAFIALFVVVFAGMRLEVIPGNMLGALLVLTVFGGLLYYIGAHLPILRSYLGGGTVVCIFGAAAMKYFHIFPQSNQDSINTFLSDTGFLDFFIVALIVGSILSMDRQLLLKAAVRFLPVAFCSMAMALILVVVVGLALGYKPLDSVMFIAVPMMAGGMGAGVIPLSGIYSEALGITSAEVISRLMPASALGNIVAIMTAALLDRIGKAKPGWTGNGKLMAKEDVADEHKTASTGNTGNVGNTGHTLGNIVDYKVPAFTQMGLGLLVTLTFYLAGLILNKLVPVVHTYAWMIILTALVKGIGIVPEKIAGASWQWSQFVMKTWTHAILIGIGITLIDLDAVSSAITPSYLFLIILVVFAVAFGAAIGGKLVGFHPIESAITAGLCTTNMGGSGNIAVLSAAHRMELLPFAQLATRICGSVVLVLASMLVKLF